ncbi:MAG: hypothetical protein ACSHX0_11690 [Akkermansiaceae bacterium]
MIEEIREKVKPLYESNDLLGFTVSDDQGKLLHNESFLSDAAAKRSVELFVNCSLSLLKAGRKSKRFTVELDDVILVYCSLDAGNVVFTLDGACDLDVAANLLSPARF